MIVVVVWLLGVVVQVEVLENGLRLVAAGKVLGIQDAE